MTGQKRARESDCVDELWRLVLSSTAGSSTTIIFALKRAGGMTQGAEEKVDKREIHRDKREWAEEVMTSLNNTTKEHLAYCRSPCLRERHDGARYIYFPDDDPLLQDLLMSSH